MTASIYDHQCVSINGDKVSMSEYQGKVLLIVNTASKCGFTPQFKGLESLHEQFSAQGFEVLGFPCNQFGKQDPGSSAEISEFCELNYGVSFPMFEKIEVNGDHTDPLFKQLKSEAPGLMGSNGIKWNFTKFLIDSEGKVVKRFASTTTPEKITGEIEKLLS